MRAKSATLLLLALLAGCLGTDRADGPEDGVPDDPMEPIGPHVVVADIDSGINVYHDRFKGNLSDALVESFVDAATGQPPARVRLSQDGNFTQRYGRDAAVWGNLSRGTLYYFEGTRVLGISFLSDESDENPVLDHPDGSHGTGTAGSVLDANPEAIVVLVEGVGNGEGELWAMSQPWVDVTTMSYGPVGSPPTSALEETGTHAATHNGWRAGKLTVGAADNTPSLSPNDQTAGPPWVIGVAGDHLASGCRDHVSGTFPDVTANFTQRLPDADEVDTRHTTSGTSFATPTTAGTLSAMVLEVRKAWGHDDGIVGGALAIGPEGQRITNADVRAAMNATAYYFGATQCPPSADTALPVNPFAPWLQMGWGHVGPEIVPDAVALLLAGDTAVPGEKAAAATFQGALYEYRTRLWGAP